MYTYTYIYLLTYLYIYTHTHSYREYREAAAGQVGITNGPFEAFERVYAHAPAYQDPWEFEGRGALDKGAAGEAPEGLPRRNGQ